MRRQKPHQDSTPFWVTTVSVAAIGSRQLEHCRISSPSLRCNRPSRSRFPSRGELRNTGCAGRRFSFCHTNHSVTFDLRSLSYFLFPLGTSLYHNLESCLVFLRKLFGASLLWRERGQVRPRNQKLKDFLLSFVIQYFVYQYLVVCD